MNCSDYRRKETKMSPKLITGFTLLYALYTMSLFAKFGIYVKCVRRAKDNIMQFIGIWSFSDEQGT